MTGRAAAVALLLAAATLFSAPEAQAADHSRHGGHQPQAEHSTHQMAVQAEQAPAEEPGPHHGDHCHCISAACAPLLHVAVPEFAGFDIPVRHDRPGAMEASALADPHPPSQPPRA